MWEVGVRTSTASNQIRWNVGHTIKYRRKSMSHPPHALVDIHSLDFPLPVSLRSRRFTRHTNFYSCSYCYIVPNLRRFQQSIYTSRFIISYSVSDIFSVVGRWQGTHRVRMPWNFNEPSERNRCSWTLGYAILTLTTCGGDQPFQATQPVPLRLWGVQASLTHAYRTKTRHMLLPCNCPFSNN